MKQLEADEIKSKFVYVITIIVAAGLVFLWIRWNDYRVKELVDVLDAGDIDEIAFRKFPLDETEQFNQIVNNPESIQQLVEFFDQYEVKKTGIRNFTSQYPDEQVVFQLDYTDDRVALPSLIERDVVLVGEEQYKILNGPIDFQWIDEFINQTH